MNNLISNYINNLDINNVNSFLENNNIYLSHNELDFTYNFIIKNWKEIMNNPNTFDFNNYKDKYSLDNFNKLNILINNYRNKYNI